MTAKYKYIGVRHLWEQGSTWVYLSGSEALKCAFDEPSEPTKGSEPGT